MRYYVVYKRTEWKPKRLERKETIILTDEFRTGDAAVIEIVEYNQPTIDAILNGVENGGYTNGTVSVE